MTDKLPDDTYVLVPSYKSAAHLKRFMNELTAFVPKGHVCVVDDASNDGTYEYCVDSGIMCLRHGVNKGKGAALRTGFAYLTDTLNAKWILTMDADGQHSPADLYKFIKVSREYPATGLCIGVRDMRLGVMPPARIVSNRLTSAILSLLTQRAVKDSQCGYRLYSDNLIKSVPTHYNRFQMESEIIIKAAAENFPIRFVSVQTLYLKGGTSHISHVVDTFRWIAAALTVWRSVRGARRRKPSTRNSELGG